MTEPSEPSETRIMLWIIAQLQERYPDDLWERQNVLFARAGNRVIRAGTVGQADIRGVHRGRPSGAGVYVELEVKRPGQKQTPEQVKRQANVTRAGGVYAVVHNPEEAFAVVDAL